MSALPLICQLIWVAWIVILLVVLVVAIWNAIKQILWFNTPFKIIVGIDLFVAIIAALLLWWAL